MREFCLEPVKLEKRIAWTRHRWSFPGARHQRCVAAGLTLFAWYSLTFAQDQSAPARTFPEPSEEKQSEQEGSISYGAQVAFRSGHADRGFVINDRPVVQPVMWWSGSVAEFSLWGSFPLAQTTDGSRPQIVELEVTSGHQWKDLSMAPAARMFYYDDRLSSSSTRSLEAWLYLSYDAGPFSLFSNQSVDVLTYRGAYYGEAGIESEWHVSQTVEVGGSFGAGWASSKFNDLYVDIYRSAFNRISVEGWLTLHVEPHNYFSTHVEFSTIMDPGVRAGATRPTFILVRFATGVEMGGSAK